MKSEEQTELLLSTLNSSRNKPAPYTGREFLERLEESSIIALVYLTFSLWQSSALWTASGSTLKFWKCGRELEVTKEKENVCLALFSLTISLPIWLRSFDLPTMHRDFKGTAGCRDALKWFLFEMKTMIINSLVQKLSQQQLYLTDWKLWRVCLKGLHGWVIKQLEISLAESPLLCSTKPVSTITPTDLLGNMLKQNRTQQQLFGDLSLLAMDAGIRGRFWHRSNLLLGIHWRIHLSLRDQPTVPTACSAHSHVRESQKRQPKDVWLGELHRGS